MVWPRSGKLYFFCIARPPDSAMALEPRPRVRAPASVLPMVTCLMPTVWKATTVNGERDRISPVNFTGTGIIGADAHPNSVAAKTIRPKPLNALFISPPLLFNEHSVKRGAEDVD